MTKITEIKNKISMLSAGAFQELCDAYLVKEYPGEIVGLGLHDSSERTTSGTPDSYIKTSDGKYIFIEYTTQQVGLYKKMKEDLEKCFDPSKAVVEPNLISLIIYCHTSSNLNTSQDRNLQALCEEKEVPLRIIGIDSLAHYLSDYPGILKDQLGINPDSGQVLEKKDFVEFYNRNALAAPLDTHFFFREKEMEQIENSFKLRDVVILVGSAGVGKSRLALNFAEKYANENNFQIYCIRNNGLAEGLYLDLLRYLKKEEKYFLVIDDANEFKNLQEIINWVREIGSEIKIILTVRDYVLKDLCERISLKEFVEIIKINLLQEKEIELILEKSLGIKNQIFIDQINKIASGNARIAVLAGKWAIDSKGENSFQSIRDASDLYEKYYGKLLKDNPNILEEKNLKALGLIAFFQKIDMEIIVSILDQLNFTLEEFKKSTKWLERQELIDIFNQRVLQISDQSLGNYLLKYVFIDREIISISKIIEFGFSYNQQATIYSFNTLARVFQSQEIRQQLQNVICDIWDRWDKENNSLFPDFVKHFFSIRPLETLIMIRERVENENTSPFESDKINFDAIQRINNVEDEHIRMLSLLSNNKEFSSNAVKLLVMFYQKRPDLFGDFYHAINNNFTTINRYDDPLKFFSTCQILKILKDRLDCPEIRYLILKLAKSFLKLDIHSFGEFSKGTHTMMQISLELSEGVKKYRSLLFGCLTEIANLADYREDIIKIINSYSRGFAKDVEEVIDFDMIYLKLIVEKLLSAEDINDCIIVVDLVKRLEGNKESKYSSLFQEYFDNSLIKIYLLISSKCDYKKSIEERGEEIEKYIAKRGFGEFEDFLKCYDGKNDYWEFSSFMPVGIKHLKKDIPRFIAIVEILMQKDSIFLRNGYTIIQALFESIPEGQVYELITKYDYEEKSNWLYLFFSENPENQISLEHCKGFLEYIRIDTTKRAGGRGLKFLEKYEKHDPEILFKVCDTLNKLFENKPFECHLYVYSLFMSHRSSFTEVLLLFEGKEKLLSELYLKIMAYDHNFDYQGSCFLSLYRVNSQILNDYIQYYLEERFDNRHEALEPVLQLWMMPQYMEIMDSIINELTVLNEGVLYDKTYDGINKILLLELENKNLSERQDEWIKRYIDKYYENSMRMEFLFRILIKLPDERRREHVLDFISKNTDYQIFEKLRLEDLGYSCVGSAIPTLIKKRKFLESLLPYLDGLDFLKHKKRIEELIKYWDKRIFEKEISELLEDY